MYYWSYHSTHNAFAAKTFCAGATDYELSPDNANPPDASVRKTHRKFQNVENNQIETLIRNLKISHPPGKIPFPNKEGYEFVEASRITHCQANGAYTKIFLDNRKSILVSKTLKDIEEQLPPDIFQRIHHSTVINMGFISHFVRSDGGYVKLQSGERLPVSKSKKDGLMERLGLK